MSRRSFSARRATIAVGAAACLLAHGSAATAQRASENVVQASEDAFGVSIGTERTGLYGESEVRGFSPIVAGNARIEGMYLDRQASLTARIVAGSAIRVGLTAQGYPFPAPTGIVDYRLRPVGAKRISSVYFSAGPYDGHQVDLDVQIPVSAQLSLGAGASYRVDEATPGDTAEFVSRGLLARWSPNDHLTVRPFWGRVDWSNDHATPFVFLSTSMLPPKFKRAYYGQPWAVADGYAETFGTLAEARLSSTWSLRAGVFGSNFAGNQDYADLFRNTRADGTADRIVVAQRGQSSRSLSGEVRATATVRDGDKRHLVHVVARARQVEGAYGGAARASLGQGRVGEIVPISRPTLTYGTLSHQTVDQHTLGLGYEGYWREKGELSAGVQRTFYKKEVQETAGRTSRRDDPWLFNSTLAVYPWRAFAVYAGYTTGLEESGTAPENATNFPETLPAFHTSQMDAGLRWSITPKLKLVVGGFHVVKPYFNLNSGGRFEGLGDVVNRGVEASLAGTLAPDVSIVGGVVFSDPHVEVGSGSLAAVGGRPVGLPKRNARLNVEYRPSRWPQYSVDAAIGYVGDRPADVANLINVPSYATLDLGARYRFRIGPAPATLRILMTNVTDEFAWRVSGGSALQPIEPRRASVSLTADF